MPSALAASFDATVAALPAYVPPPELTYARYRVRRGDTLSTIARRYRNTVTAIMRANSLSSRNRIREGQRLKIPQRGGSTPAVAAGPSGGSSRTHTVRRGDSLWKLASRYGITVDRIKQDNGLRGNDLAVGQKLDIRSGSAPGSRSYTVRAGDTIGRIAQAENVSVEKLLRTNGLSRSSKIYPGQVIRFPNRAPWVNERSLGREDATTSESTRIVHDVKSIPRIAKMVAPPARRQPLAFTASGRASGPPS